MDASVPVTLKTIAGDSGTEYEFETDFNYLTNTEAVNVTAMAERSI